MIWQWVRIWLLISLAVLLAALRLEPRPTSAEELNHAGLIIRDGEGRLTYAWVPFAEDEISGIELLQASGIPVVTVGFGALGEAVCSIDGQGCGVSDCRRNVCQASSADAPYWQYFAQDRTNPAIWRWLALGPSASKVHDGDVFGWSWTAGDPSLPALSGSDVAALAGAGNGEGRTASFRTVLPEGVAPVAPAFAPDGRTAAAAAAMLLGIGIAALGIARWRRRGDEMRTDLVRPLDPRAWLLWTIAAMLPALVGRNPWPLAATLVAVLGAWAATNTSDSATRWRALVRLAMLFAVVSVIFNLLTAHVGDAAFGSLPAEWPIIGGPLTFNALLYGLLSAAAILALVVAGVTIAANLDWSLTMRLLPERLAALSVAGSIAWTYLPRTVMALGEIREAQMARGFRPRGLRDALPLAVPLLAGGLERAMTTAEALEARAFGATASPTTWLRPGQAIALGFGLLAAVTGSFCLALNQLVAAVVLLSLAAVTLVLSLRTDPSEPHGPRRTRYRDPVWERAEWVVGGAAVVVFIVEIGVLLLDPTAFRYEPYPSITAPGINLPLLAALALLLAPGVVRA